METHKNLIWLIITKKMESWGRHQEYMLAVQRDKTNFNKGEDLGKIKSVFLKNMKRLGFLVMSYNRNLTLWPWLLEILLNKFLIQIQKILI